MPISGCSSPSKPSSEPAQDCDGTTQSCPYAGRITNLTVVEGARQDDVVGPDRWATVKRSGESVVIEATTEPNTPQVWSRLTWSGDAGEAVPGQQNRRRLSRADSRVLRPTASLAGVTRSIEIWVVAATIEIKASGQVPPNAAQFQSLFGPASQDLGPTTYESMIGNVYPGDTYVLNMGARGKIVAIATLTPAGVHDVVKSGWTFRRERWTAQWENGRLGSQTTTDWTDDTSNAAFLRLNPDSGDRIYDTDGPDIRWGTSSYEIYHNFRQIVQWHSEPCSAPGFWFFRALWRANKIQSKQIVLNEVGPGQKPLPTSPAK